MKRIIGLVLAFLILFSFVACSKDSANKDDSYAETTVKINNAPGLDSEDEKLLSVKLNVILDEETVSKDEKFGSAILNKSQEEFEAIGFKLGDSCNVEFDNGYKLEDVPYYNGYYVRNGAPVIVAYPGDGFIRITLNNRGIWDEAGLKEGDSVSITLNESGKYLSVQETLGQVYSFNRDDYPSDEAFSNFRALSAGNIKENFVFRGASPVDNSRGRAAYTDALIKQNYVQFIIDLADSEEDYKQYSTSDNFNSPYAKSLHDSGNTVLLDMGSSYSSQPYKEKVVEGLRKAIEHDGPLYIHCMEGKDRTGFVCLLLEALCGATYGEMEADYMKTYENYFKVTKDSTPEKHEAIVDLYFVPFIEYLTEGSELNDYENADFTDFAKAYLNDGGMADKEIESLIYLISTRQSSEYLNVISVFQSEYTILSTEDSASTLDLCAQFRDEMKKLTGASMKLYDNNSNSDKAYDLNKPYFLVGQTDFTESKYTDVLIKANGGERFAIYSSSRNVAVNGTSDYSIYRGLCWLIDNCINTDENGIISFKVPKHLLKISDELQPEKETTDYFEALNLGYSLAFRIEKKLLDLPYYDYFDTMQGGCSDGTYAYFAVLNSRTGKGIIYKYDINSWQLLYMSKPIFICQANDMTYDSKNNRLVIPYSTKADDYLTLCFVNPVDLTVMSTQKISVKTRGIEYLPSSNRYFLASPDCRFTITTDDFQPIYDFTCMSTAYTTQGMYCDEKYIYDLRYVPDSSTHYVVVQGLDGLYYGERPIHNLKDEPENIFKIGDGQFAMGCYESRAVYLLRVTRAYW